MLTKQHLKFTKRSGRLYPKFLPVSSLKVADDVCSVFKDCEGKTLDEIDEKFNDSCTNDLVATAFKKLLTDRCEFADDDGEILDRRWRLFEAARELKENSNFDNFRSFQNEFYRLHEYAFSKDAVDLFGDLPDFRVVQKFRSFSPQELVHRYNSAQIQGLLIKATHLNLKLKDLNLVQKRGFFRTLKFHQLLAEIDSDEDSELKLTLSGPLALFGESAGAYGLRLANFFPHVLSLPKWEMQAEVKLNNSTFRLKLDQSVAIQSHYQGVKGYVPEEFQRFFEQMKNLDKNWRVNFAEGVINLGNGQYCVPDFRMSNSNKTIFGEIFHRWHARQLSQRLDSLRANPRGDIILLVEKGLMKDQSDPCLFPFSTFPIAKKLLLFLNKNYSG